ncbi:MAG: DUF2971 domain-containing protein [Bryobacteraceae bacterium]|jgi:hypothetical protein
MEGEIVEPEPTSIYRFRSTGKLLRQKFQELDKQEIYFASRSELNDPMEGFKNILWKGDHILWTNLLNHYLLCLMHAVLAANISGPGHKPADCDAFVLQTERSLATPELHDIYREIREGFFRHQDASLLPDLLSARASPVRGNELTYYLRLIHLHALNTVWAVFEDRGYMKARPPDHPLRAESEKRISPLRELFDNLKASELRHPNRPEYAESISTAICRADAQMTIILAYNGISLLGGPAWQAVIGEFPERYVASLEKLLYFDWYTACFVGYPTHAAMWGYYGDGHKGVCLKFRTHLNAARTPSIMLWPTGAVTGHDNAAVAIPLHRINYNGRFVEVDYFRSLGRVLHPDLNYWWYDSAGKPSFAAEEFLGDPDGWRRRYWDNFYMAATTKLPDWGDEEEYRLIYSPSSDLADKSSRKLKYRFEDLQALIFGIRTSFADKLELIRIICAKCDAQKRKEFEFYQACYSSNSGTIDIFPLSLLRCGAALSP